MPLWHGPSTSSWLAPWFDDEQLAGLRRSLDPRLAVAWPSRHCYGFGDSPAVVAHTARPVVEWSSGFERQPISDN